jgi:4'-phosphopantetheinyl transferase
MFEDPAALRGETVQIWRLRTDEAILDLDRLAANLSVQEVKRANRYRLARDRQRYIAAHGLLRRILGAKLGLHPSAVGFVTGPAGKPELLDAQNQSRLRFSLSYTDGLALIVVTAGCAVGLDVERVREENDLLDLAARFFHSAEQQQLRELAAGKRGELFCVYWTRKEAYVKLRGSGLSDKALREYNTAGWPDQPMTWHSLPEGMGAGVDFLPAPGCRASLALAGPPRPIQFVT